MGLKHCNDPKAFIDYSSNMGRFDNADRYNPKKPHKV